MDFLLALLDQKEAFQWIFFITLLWAFYRWMNSDTNELELWHFISTRSPLDGRHYADIDKLGKVTGIVFGSFVLVRLSGGQKVDLAAFALVLGTYFAFVGGVAGYSAYLRAKSGRVETVTETEPARPAAPTKTTVTKSSPAPSVDEPMPVKVVAGPGVEEPLKVSDKGKD